MVTVCHYCNQTFAADETHYDFSVINYVNLVAGPIGLRRKDKSKQYMLWGNLDPILKDADEHIAESPFGSERIWPDNYAEKHDHHSNYYFYSR